MHAPRLLRPTAVALCLAVLAPTLVLFTPASAAPDSFGWTAPTLIYGGGQGRNSPATQIALDDAGNRLAVWYDFNKAIDLFASYAPVGGEWTAPIPITPQTGGNIVSFELAMSSSGNATVAWLIRDYLIGAGLYVYRVGAAFYSKAGGWGYAEQLELIDINGTAAWRATAPSVAIDAAGRSVIAWTQTVDYFGTNETDVYTAYHEGTWVNWTLPEVIDTLPGEPGGVKVAAAPGGTNFAAWTQMDAGGNLSLFSAVYTPGAGWSAPSPREVDSHPVELFDLGSDSAGQAELVWSQGPPSLALVFASTYNGSAWSTVTTVDANPAPHLQLSLAGNAAGEAVAAWISVSAPNWTLRGSLYDKASGWAPSTLLEVFGFYPVAVGPVMDGAGNALLLWMGVVNLYFPTVNAKAYSAADGWQPSEKISGDYDMPEDIAVMPDGRASAAIRRFDGTFTRPFEMQYLPLDLTPPALSVTAPVGGAHSNTTFVTVRGSTEPGAFLTVNGAPTLTAADGHFEAVVELAVGAATITVEARDSEGNAAAVSVAVTVDDTAAALSAELHQTQADLAALQATVAAQGALQSQINALEGDIATLEAELVAARARANATEAMVNSAPAGAGSSGLALGAGLAGVALGAVGLLVALQARKPGRKPADASTSAPSTAEAAPDKKP